MSGGILAACSYYRGHYNLEAQLDSMVATRGLSSFEEIVLSGCSVSMRKSANESIARRTPLFKHDGLCYRLGMRRLWHTPACPKKN